MIRRHRRKGQRRDARRRHETTHEKIERYFYAQRHESLQELIERRGKKLQYRTDFFRDLLMNKAETNDKCVQLIKNLMSDLISRDVNRILKDVRHRGHHTDLNKAIEITCELEAVDSDKALELMRMCIAEACRTNTSPDRTVHLAAIQLNAWRCLEEIVRYNLELGTLVNDMIDPARLVAKAFIRAKESQKLGNFLYFVANSGLPIPSLLQGKAGEKSILQWVLEGREQWALEDRRQFEFEGRKLYLECIYQIVGLISQKALKGMDGFDVALLTLGAEAKYGNHIFQLVVDILKDSDLINLCERVVYNGQELFFAEHLHDAAILCFENVCEHFRKTLLCYDTLGVKRSIVEQLYDAGIKYEAARANRASIDERIQLRLLARFWKQFIIDPKSPADGESLLQDWALRAASSHAYHNDLLLLESLLAFVVKNGLDTRGFFTNKHPLDGQGNASRTVLEWALAGGVNHLASINALVQYAARHMEEPLDASVLNTIFCLACLAEHQTRMAGEQPPTYLAALVTTCLQSGANLEDKAHLEDEFPVDPVSYAIDLDALACIEQAIKYDGLSQDTIDRLNVVFEPVEEPQEDHEDHMDEPAPEPVEYVADSSTPTTPHMEIPTEYLPSAPTRTIEGKDDTVRYPSFDFSEEHSGQQPRRYEKPGCEASAPDLPEEEGGDVVYPSVPTDMMPYTAPQRSFFNPPSNFYQPNYGDSSQEGATQGEPPPFEM